MQATEDDLNRDALTNAMTGQGIQRNANGGGVGYRAVDLSAVVSALQRGGEVVQATLLTAQADLTQNQQALTQNQQALQDLQTQSALQIQAAAGAAGQQVQQLQAQLNTANQNLQAAQQAAQPLAIGVVAFDLPALTNHQHGYTDNLVAVENNYTQADSNRVKVCMTALATHLCNICGLSGHRAAYCWFNYQLRGICDRSGEDQGAHRSFRNAIKISQDRAFALQAAQAQA